MTCTSDRVLLGARLSARREPLDLGASPAAIRAGLLPEDRDRFDAALDTALRDVRSSLDLRDLFTMLERWRRLAVVQSDPAGFARLARRAAEKLTGAAPPEDEPPALTRATTDM